MPFRFMGPQARSPGIPQTTPCNRAIAVPSSPASSRAVHDDGRAGFWCDAQCWRNNATEPSLQQGSRAAESSEQRSGMRSSRGCGTSYPMRALIRLATFVFCLAALPAGAEDAPALKPPFLLMKPEAVKKRDVDCPAAPSPMQSLDLASKYGDDGPERDDIDEEAEKAFETAMEPLRDYAALVVRQANRFTGSGRSGDAGCAIGLLEAWAKAGALANPKTKTAIFKLATTLSALSTAWLQVRMMAEPPARREIDQWLSARATLVRILMDASKARSMATGNHRAWAGYGAAVTGVATGREDLLAWGEESYMRIVCGAEESGALPTEMRRGKKARDYHLFALAPLVMLAETAAANGRDLYAACGGKLHTILAFTITALDDPTAIAAEAGAEQMPFQNDAALPPNNRLAFLEGYLRRFPGRTPGEARFLALRPLRSTDLGGDLTLLFGGKQ